MLVTRCAVASDFICNNVNDASTNNNAVCNNQNIRGEFLSFSKSFVHSGSLAELSGIILLEAILPSQRCFYFIFESVALG